MTLGGGHSVGIIAELNVACILDLRSRVQVNSSLVLGKGDRDERYNGDDHDEDAHGHEIVVVSRQQCGGNEWCRQGAVVTAAPPGWAATRPLSAG